MALILIIGVALLLIPTGKASEPKQEEAFFTKQYKEQTEQALENMLEQVRGVGKASVMITFQDNGESRYAADEQQQTDSAQSGQQQKHDTSVVLKNDSGGGESAVLISEKAPEISGVLVVCEGGGTPEVRQAVVAGVQAVLGVYAHRIAVLEQNG